MDTLLSTNKAMIAGAVDMIKKSFTFVPDEKLHFTPSPTAKSPIQIGAHVVLTNFGFAKMLKGESSPFASVRDLLVWMEKKEKEFTTREQLESGFDSSAQALHDALNSLTPESLEQTVKSALGERKIGELVVRIAPHIQMHKAQIDYIQTIWGDTDPHM